MVVTIDGQREGTFIVTREHRRWNTSRPADGLRPLRAVPEAFTLRAA